MAISSYDDVLRFILSQVQELTDGTSDLATDAGDHLLASWREFWSRHPWLSLIKDPPGAFVTTDDDTTTYTITISSTGTGVTGTLSAAPAASIAGYKIRPSGVDWHTRVTAHTAASTSVTLDAVPATIAAGTAITLFRDEYTLASDLGLFVDGLWYGPSFVPLWSEEKLKNNYPDPPSGASIPIAFCRLTETKIRLSHYPTASKRVEYPYAYRPSDPSGSSALAISTYLIPAYARLALSYLADQMVDRRATRFRDEAEALIERAIVYEERMKTGLGSLSRLVGRAPYQ